MGFYYFNCVYTTSKALVMGKATFLLTVTLVTALHAVQGLDVNILKGATAVDPKVIDWVFPNDNGNPPFAKISMVDLSDLRALTACFWFNTTALNKYHVHLDWEVASLKNLHVASSSVGVTNELLVYIRGEERKFIALKPLHDGVWHHVCTSWDGVKGEVNAYLDGEPQSSSENFPPIKTTLPSSGNLIIGKESPLGSGFARNFTGQMSRINLWNNVVNKSVLERMSKSCQDGEQGSKIPWSRLIKEAKLSKVLVRNSTCPIARGRDCLDLLRKGYKSDGFYLINPDNNGFFSVMCDQQTNGGGWVVFQRRMDGSVNFHRNWDDYKVGFGNPNGEFWLGNDQITRIVSTYHQLLIELQDSTNDKAFDFYNVMIEDESKKYELVVQGYSEGTAGKMLHNQKNLWFSTYDRDNDHNELLNYASHFQGGFWIKYSSYNLNARYSTTGYNIRWYYWNYFRTTITNTEMKLRSIRERNSNYGLSFDGEQSSSYVLYRKVKGFKNATVCAWVKVLSSEKTHCLFSIFNENQRFQICFSNNSKQITISLAKTTQVISLDQAAFIGSHWTPFCFARQSYSGMWKLRVRDKEIKNGRNLETNTKFEDGSLIIGQKVDNQSSGIIAGSSFVGDLTSFSIWSTFLTDQTMSSYAGGCMRDYGEIPWPETSLWINGNIKTYDVYLCNSFKVDRTWNLDRNGTRMFQDVSRGTSNAFMKHTDTRNVSTDLNVFSSDEKGCIDLTGNKFNCLSDPSNCLEGFTLSFWLKHGENFISRILEERTEQKKQLQEMLSPVVESWSKWSLCYRASKHGWDPRTFHLNCDNKIKTLTIVKVKNYVFGGFIDHSWGGGNQAMNSTSAFLFSLSNPEGCPPFKLKIKPDFTSKAAQSNSYSGPVFGLNDLYLGDVFFSDLGQAYELPNISCIVPSNNTSIQERARHLLAGSYYFVPDEIEVFEYVVPKLPKYILSAGGQSCGVSFIYNEKKEHQFTVSIKDRIYTLSVPALNTSKWSRITVTWSTMSGLLLRQDNITISDFSITYKQTVTCPTTYIFALGCAAWAVEQNIANSVNFQLTDLQLYDTYLTQKEIEKKFDWKTNFFKPVAIFNAARSKELNSFSSNVGANNRILSGHRGSLHNFCFWLNSIIDPDPWWEINLVQKYIVTDIFIVRGFPYYEFYNLKIRVSDGQNKSNCHGIHDIGWRTHGRFYCDNHPAGRAVKVSFAVKTTSSSVALLLCEIEVRGFLFPGYWLVNSSYPRYKGENVYYRTDFVLSVRNCLTFHYIIDGTDAGRLNVYSGGYLGKKTLLWRLAGDQGHNKSIDRTWSTARVPISEETAFQIVFEAVVGKEYGGYIAVDNVTLSTSNSCLFYPIHASNQMSGIMSNMIQHIPSYKDWLLSAVSQAGYSDKLWVSCYHSINDGWNSSAFHYKCLGKGPFIVILRHGSKIFGGFSDVSTNEFLASSTKNYASGRPTKQINSKNNRGPEQAVDGDIKTYTRTEDTQDPWWRVELEYPIFVFKLTIYNRHEKSFQDRLYDFEIIISNQLQGVSDSSSKCGGLHSLKNKGSGTFYCKPAIYGKYVTVHMKRSGILNLGEVKVYGFRRPILSTKSFLYTLSATKSKLNVRPDKGPAIIFMENGMRFGFYDLVISIAEKKCSNAPGDLYEALPGNQVFTGSNEFQPDDIEVLIVGDSLCDPPCLKGERCDEVLNKCVCDLERRDYKLCLERRDLQDKRDKFCRALKKSEFYARYDLIENISVGKRWRCYGKYALTDDRLRYNTTKLSMDYETRHDELMAIEAEFPKLIYDRMVEYLSIIYWPLDHPNDLKDLNNDQWSSNVYDGQPVRGVIDGALLLNGTGDVIKLPLSSTISDSCFFHPRGGCTNGLAISLWIKYYFSRRNGGKQVFFSTSVDGQDRGFVIYQINSSFPHVAVSVIHSNNCCTKVVEFARGIWTHLAVVYHNRNDVDIPEVYINSTKDATVIWEGCVKRSYKSVSNDYFTIGQSDVGAPYASIDDIVIVLNAETYLSSLSNVYNYYKGRENLHLNASFVLTSESWNDNLLNRESDIYRKISTSLLKNISDANLKRTVKNQEIRFWKKEGESIMGFTGCNILIGFHGRGYSQMHDVISYLEQATDIITDLSSSSNEVYLKGPQPVEVSIYGNSMKIKIQWNPGDKNLTHGILQKYVLFYVNGEDPSDQGQVDVVLDEIGDSTNYNLTVTKYFSRYLVSVRADTLEGEGKVSKGVNITTGILAPLGPPQTVHSWNLSSVGIAVSWTDINETYLRGPIAGYSIRINLADSPERAWESSKFQSILHNKSVIFEGLYKYTKYNVHVAGVAKENQFGPYIQGSVWTGEDAPEMAPSQLSAEAVDSTSIVVTWTEIQANKRNGIIIGYSVKWKEVNFDNEAGNISVPATPLSYTVTGLKIFTYYKVFVAGFTVIGIGPYKEAHVRTGEDIPDACPNITKAYNASSTSLFVMWQPIPKQNRNGILQGYVFEVCKEDGTFEKLFYHNSSSLEARITGLSKYQTYQIKIAGFTSKGRGNFSLPVIATTDEDVPESPPRNISKQKEESNAVTLNWQPPSSKQVNGIVLGYNIALKDLLRDKISYKRVNTSTHLRIDGLYPYTDYEITIRAFTRKGDGIVGEKIAIKTEQSAPTGSPTNVIVQPNLSSSSSITVSWGPVDRFKVNGQVTSYVLITFELANPDSTRRNVTISAQSNPHRKKRAVPSSTISTQLTGFQPFTQYGIQILAVTNVNGVPSPIYNVTTAEDTPSHPPLNLTAHNTSSTSIKVTWNEIPQKHKNGIIIGYKIHYKASHTGLFIKTVINDTERHTELTGLEKYELYTIQILGFTAKGDGNLSEPVTVRTAEDVPDDAPAKVSSVNPTLTTLTIQWETMPVRLENGIIRGYEVVLFEMNGVTKANAVLNDGNIKLSTVISGLDVWTNYTVQVKAFTSVGSGPWSPRVRVTTDEQAPQDTPFNVTAHFLSSTSIRVSWQPIDPRLTKGVARGYRVYYRALDTPFTKPLLNHTVGLMETSADLTNLYKYVEYSIYVVAVTNKDGNASAVVVTRTDEDKPDRPPLTLIYTLPDPTSIWLGWDEVREGYKNGIILGYKMTYRDTTKSDPPTFKSFLPDQFSTTLRDLDSYIHYEITLLAFTIKGDGPPFTRVIRTDQNTPYMSPGNFTAENYTTTSSLPVLWQPIPPHGLPGILLGYRLYYTPVSTGEYDIEEGETKEIRIPADKTRFVLPGLDIYTKYRVEISGFTVKGDGPLSITFGKTCRCQKRLSSSWLHFPPYVIASDNDSVPAGIIPSIAHKMVLHCCHHCKEYGKSYLDMKLNGYNMPAQEKHLETLKIHIDGMTDIIFPLAGYRTQEVYKVPYGFIGLVGTPGVAFVLSKTSTDGLMVGEMAASIWKNWTLVLLSLLFAFITGCLIWFLENRKNEEHFPKPFSKGSMEGFWFTFISMTTVGYGDRCPLSVAGRIVAITWTLFGVVLISMIVGNIAASLTTVAVNEGGSLYGMKAGALKNSFEYRFGIRRSAKMNEEREYDSYDEIYDDLVNQRIKGALLDSFAVGSRRDLFEKPFIRIKSIYDLNLASGIVTARNSTKLNRCLRRFTRSNAKEISDTIEDNARAVEVENEPLASELSSGVFDANNPVFTKVLAAICVLLGLFGSIGIIWEIIYVKRLSVFCNVGPDDLRLRFLKAARKELGKTTENFLIRLSVVVKHLQEKHSQERQQLIAAQSCKADEILKQS